MKVVLRSRSEKEITLEGFKYPLFPSSPLDDEQLESPPEPPTDMEGILEDLHHTWKVLQLIDLPNLDYDQFDHLNFHKLPYIHMVWGYRGETKDLEARGRTRDNMTIEDWRSHVIRIGHLVLACLRLNFLTQIQSHKENIDEVNIVLKVDREAPQARIQQFQHYSIALHVNSQCDIFTAYGSSLSLQRHAPYPLLVQVLCYQGLLVLFELIIEGATRCDSPEGMKEWVTKKIEEDYISQRVFGSLRRPGNDIFCTTNFDGVDILNCSQMKVALSTRFKRLITMENFKYPFRSSSFDEEQHGGGFEFSPNPMDMERILDDIDDARKILDLVNHHDLDHNKFTRPLFSELSTWTNMMKAYQQETIRLESRGRTRSTMTMGDWRSHLIHIGRLVLADLKWFSLSHMGEFKKQNEENTNKDAPEIRNDQFPTLICCVRPRPDSFCDIYSAYTEIYRLLRRRLCPPITQLLFFQWLLAFFELVIKAARDNDSPEAMKQWVDKLIEEGYLSQSFLGSGNEIVCTSNFGSANVVLANVIPTRRLIVDDEQQHGGGCAKSPPLGRLEDINYTRKVLDLVNHQDLDHLQFAHTLSSDLSPWTNMIKAYQEETRHLESHGRTRNTMTIDDWRSHVIHISHFVLVDLRWFFLSHISKFKEQKEETDIVLNTAKDAREARKRQFQLFFYRVNAQSQCDIYCAYADANRLLRREPFYPLLTQVLCCQGLLVLFELIFEGANCCDSPEGMKEWVNKKIKENYISQIVLGEGPAVEETTSL